MGLVLFCYLEIRWIHFSWPRATPWQVAKNITLSLVGQRSCLETSGAGRQPGVFISLVPRIVGETNPSSKPVMELLGAIHSLYFLGITQKAGRVWQATFPALRRLGAASSSGEKCQLGFEGLQRVLAPLTALPPSPFSSQTPWSHASPCNRASGEFLQLKSTIFWV